MWCKSFGQAMCKGGPTGTVRNAMEDRGDCRVLKRSDPDLRFSRSIRDGPKKL